MMWCPPPSSPEIGDVGLSEAQAKQQGFAVKTSVFQFRELGKAQAMGELAGLFKLVVEEGSGKLLGAHIAGAHASDLIAEATLAIQRGCTPFPKGSTRLPVRWYSPPPILPSAQA